MSDDAIKVGDELAFRVGMVGTIQIHQVTAITPSGRIVCGPYTMNPDLSIRGRKDKWHSPWRGERVSETHRETVRVQESYNLSEQWRFTKKELINPDRRMAVDNAIREALKAKEQA